MNIKLKLHLDKNSNCKYKTEHKFKLVNEAKQKCEKIKEKYKYKNY